MSDFRNVLVLTGLPLLGEARAIKLPDDIEEVDLDKKELEALTKVLSESKFPTRVLILHGQGISLLVRGKY